jgi:hypothetical protein
MRRRRARLHRPEIREDRLKEVIHPFTGRSYKLGRKPSPPQRHLCLGAYLKAADLPQPPRVCHYSPQAEHGLAMILGNDQLGDCTAAAAAHLIDVWRGNSGQTAPAVTEADAISFYSRTTGYQPGYPASDQGGDLVTVMTRWRDSGFYADEASKILGWAAVDAGDPREVRTAIWLFEGLYMGAGLPDEWLHPPPDANAFVWGVAGEPDQDNGHCTAAVGYNAVGVQVATWGMIGTVRWDALAKYWSGAARGELYALLSPEAINRATRKAASGFDIVALQADLASL